MSGRHTSQHELLLASLTHYFSKGTAFQTVNAILQGKTSVSLRLIDWFVVCYSKKHNTVITVPGAGDAEAGDAKAGNGEPINVYLHYRAQLRAFSKHLFDPFRRQEKMTLTHQSETMLTTIGQLNFFRWALDYCVLDYIRDHVDEITKDMNQAQKDMRQKGNGPVLAVETAVAENTASEAALLYATAVATGSSGKKTAAAAAAGAETKDRRRECTVKNISVVEGVRRLCFD